MPGKNSPWPWRPARLTAHRPQGDCENCSAPADVDAALSPSPPRTGRGIKGEVSKLFSTAKYTKHANASPSPRRTGLSTFNPQLFGSISPMNQSSTRFRAHGVLRRNVRLDLTVGLNWKQRTGMRRPISSQPCRWTSWLRMASSVMPCNGSRGWETGDVMSEFSVEGFLENGLAETRSAWKVNFHSSS